VAPVLSESESSKGKTDGLTDPLEGLRKVLALEGSKKYSNTAVVGGLDAYLQHIVSESLLQPSHPVITILENLPRGGYRELHPITRKRVVDQLLKAAGTATPPAPAKAQVPSEKQTTPTAGPPAPAPARPRATAAAVARVSPRPPARSSAPVIGTLDSKISVLAGISRAMEARLARIDIRTVRDLLYHFPTRYHDYSELRPIAELRMGEEQTVIGEIWSVAPTTIGRKKATEALISDGSGTMRVIWWSGHWMAKSLHQGMTVALSGKISAYRGRLQMHAPEVERLDKASLNTRRHVPVHGLTEGIEARQMRLWVRQAVDSFADKVENRCPKMSVGATLSSRPLRPFADTLPGLPRAGGSGATAVRLRGAPAHRARRRPAAPGVAGGRCRPQAGHAGRRAGWLRAVPPLQVD
jgi:ATP-dependent DNA helicase RecG